MLIYVRFTGKKHPKATQDFQFQKKPYTFAKLTEMLKKVRFLIWLFLKLFSRRKLKDAQCASWAIKFLFFSENH
jgi:hypothetical protein